MTGGDSHEENVKGQAVILSGIRRYTRKFTTTCPVVGAPLPVRRSCTRQVAGTGVTKSDAPDAAAPLAKLELEATGEPNSVVATA
jgi:hypothetical protein